MTALTGSPLLDVYRLASLVGRVAAECPDLVAELVDAQRDLEDAEAHGTKDQQRFHERRVEAREQALVAECAALRQAAGLRGAR